MTPAPVVRVKSTRSAASRKTESYIVDQIVDPVHLKCTSRYTGALALPTNKLFVINLISFLIR